MGMGFLVPMMCRAECSRGWGGGRGGARGGARGRGRYLSGAEEAAVAVIRWAHGMHPHKPLLPPEAEFPASSFLLRLPKRPDGSLDQGTFPLIPPPDRFPSQLVRDTLVPLYFQ